MQTILSLAPTTLKPRSFLWESTETLVKLEIVNMIPHKKKMLKRYVHYAVFNNIVEGSVISSTISARSNCQTTDRRNRVGRKR